MNTGLLTLNVVTGGNLKKQAALVLTTMAIIVSLPFAAVFAMGGNVLTFLSGVPSIEAAESQGFYMGGPVEGDTYAWGNCTYWAFALRLWSGQPIPTSWGNADTWDDRAISDGYVVDHTPAAGTVFQTDSESGGTLPTLRKLTNSPGSGRYLK